MLKHAGLFLALASLASLVLGLSARAAEPVGRVAQVVQPLIDKHLLAGAVTLVANLHQVLSLEAFGYADLATKEPMQIDALFWVASQSKPIAGVAVMILVDEGKLQLDDPVEQYLPEFQGQMVVAEQDATHTLLRKHRQPITLRHALTHTTGLPYRSLLEEPSLDILPLDIRVRSYAMLPLAFEPGTSHLYSTAGINTAARVVEVVSGMPYAEFLDRRIFQPLAMNDTTFWPSARQLQRLPKSYQFVRGRLQECPILKLRYPLDDRTRGPVPGAGLFSTAADLLRFYQMLAGKGTLAGRRILSAQAVAELTREQFPAANKGYGLGIEVAGPGIGHGGSYHTHSLYDRQRQLITMFMTQEVEFPKDAQNVVDTFRKAAIAAYAK